MPKPTIFLFSGQGSHYYQMGRELYDRNPAFRAHVAELDAVAREACGVSVAGEIYDERRRKTDVFDRTLYTSPAIFMVEYALARTIMAMGVTPDYVLGSSMGTFAAATIAGCLAPDEALRAIIEQARIVERHCEAGGMIALSDPDGALMRRLDGRCEVAAVNFASHYVISAKSAALAEIEESLRREGAVYQRLAVSQPFHSRWIDAAEQPFYAYARTMRPLADPAVPIVCCAEAGVLPSIAPAHFWAVIRRPIRFRDTMAALIARGPFRYVDLGPSGSLATLAKYNLPPGSDAELFPIVTPYGTDSRNLQKLGENR